MDKLYCHFCHLVILLLYCFKLSLAQFGGLIPPLSGNCTASNCLSTFESSIRMSQPTVGSSSRKPRAKVHTKMKEFRLEVIKHTILDKLGLNTSPNISKGLENEPVFHKAIQECIAKMRERHEEQARSEGYFADISEIISFAEEVPNNTLTREEQVQFSLAKDKVEENDLQVLTANLFILLRYKKTGGGKKNPVRRVRVSIHDLREPRGLPLTSLSVMVRHTRWQKLIVPRTFVQDMLDNPSASLRFKIVCENCGQDIQPILVHKKLSHRRKLSLQRRGARSAKRKRLHKRRPFLIIHTKGKSGRARFKRASDIPLQKKCSSLAKACGRHNLYVSFEDLGWSDWIIAPEGYQTNYCRGGCRAPVASKDLSEAHSGVMGHHKPGRGRPGATQCCRPTKMSSLSILYRNEQDNVIRALLPDMITEECACV